MVNPCWVLSNGGSEPTPRKMSACGRNAHPKATLKDYNNLTPEVQRNPYRFNFSLYGAAKSVAVPQDPTYGIPGVVWDCGVVLANAVAAAPARFHGRSVLEVGAATGLAAAVAWHCGASLAVATDLPQVVADVTRPTLLGIVRDAGAVPAARRESLAALPLTWGDAEEAAALRAFLAARIASGAVAAPTGGSGGPGAKKAGGGAKAGAAGATPSPAASPPPPHWDYVLAADVSYQPNMFAALLECLTAIMPPGRRHRAPAPEEDDDAGGATGDAVGGDGSDAPDGLDDGPPCHTTLLFVYRRRVTADADMLAALRDAYVEVAATPGQQLSPSYPKDNLTLYEFRTAASVAAAPPPSPAGPAGAAGGKGKAKKGK